MGLHTLDIVVLLGVGAAAIVGWMRGFVHEVLSLAAWFLVVFALKLVHAPVTQALAGMVGTATAAAVLAFVLIAGTAWFVGRTLARSIGKRMRASVLGPLDRAMGFGFGALKGLILASLAFLLLILTTDTASGGSRQRPDWLTKARTYPLLNATSAYIADVIGKRRTGQSLLGDGGNASIGAGNEPDDAGNGSASAKSRVADDKRRRE